MSVHLRPEEIEAESFRLIEEEAGPHQWQPAEWEVVRRAVHTSADFDYVTTMIFGNGAIEAGIAALKAGAPIVTDTTMALAGINKGGLASFGIPAACRVADPEVARLAREQGVTRSIIAMRSTAAQYPHGIFVIGNAPTALFELLRLVREGQAAPALVIGLPVGFVGAAESKEELALLGGHLPTLPYITNRGRKGGSNVAAAVVNALLIQAQKVLSAATKEQGSSRP